jgi:hypothetical protein
MTQAAQPGGSCVDRPALAAVIMPANRFGKGTDGKLTFQFEPIGIIDLVA